MEMEIKMEIKMEVFVKMEIKMEVFTVECLIKNGRLVA